MKRIISLMLVAMLLVGCLSTMALAEGGVRTGTISVTVSGEFSSFGGWVVVEQPAKLTGISGITGNASSGKVGYANNENVTSVTFTVSVQVPENYCGPIEAGFTQDEAYKVLKNDDGTVSGHEAVSVSGGGSTSFAHAWGSYVETSAAKDCQTPAVLTATCSICGATDSINGNVGEHVWGTEWEKNADGHWHVCTVAGCGHTSACEAHTYGDWVTTKQPTVDAEGEQERYCSVCNWKQTEKLDKLTPSNPNLPVPDMGDATPYGLYNAMVVALIAVCGVALLSFKRRSAK